MNKGLFFCISLLSSQTYCMRTLQSTQHQRTMTQIPPACGTGRRLINTQLPASPSSPLYKKLKHETRIDKIIHDIKNADPSLSLPAIYQLLLEGTHTPTYKEALVKNLWKQTHFPAYDQKNLLIMLETLQKNRNQQDPFFDGERTILHVAIHHPQFLKKILPFTKDRIDARNKKGNTPLYNAAYFILHKPVQYLVQAGADPNSINNENATPLHGSLSDLFSSHKAENLYLLPRVIKLLIDAGADPCIPNADGTIPIDIIKNYLENIEQQRRRTDYQEFGQEMIICNQIRTMFVNSEQSKE